MMWFLGKEPTGKKISTTTNSEGTYSFSSVEPASDYFMLANHPEFRQAQEQLVFVGENGEHPGPDMYLSPGSLLTGYVVDVGENPVPGALLHLDSAYMMGENDFSSRDFTMNGPFDAADPAWRENCWHRGLLAHRETLRRKARPLLSLP